MYRYITKLDFFPRWVVPSGGGSQAVISLRLLCSGHRCSNRQCLDYTVTVSELPVVPRGCLLTIFLFQIKNLILHE
jgi:hypothetical protein